ncbi:hypothetical protein HGK49_06810 [Helicobacter pylori]|uniref:PT domain-containing protein n=1 Tax=Helicobacter pylori TaxID=210 RepID=UPI001922A8C6|nr:hypothetical protein HGK49_04995 [Helicobacter pylori]QQW66683.1 hypothetical protein HGK49_06810 [Helicobacter pylori]
MASNHPTIQPSNHPTIQPSNHPTIQPSNHPTIQPSNHPTIQPSNQAIKQSSNQATLPCCYNFYQNLFKNPLFFIIPPFINPRNIFKKFDSISPIFQSVGLTELNLKERWWLS